MPPRKFAKPLSNAQIEILTRWIAGGAVYSTHWAFLPPLPRSPPKVESHGWIRNPIDAFILARLEPSHLTPSREADRTTLVRRLTLDLTGIPPTLAEVDAFVSDSNPDAYDRLVERLLGSPHYGERMAVPWLDLARYADTNGGTADFGREMWRYRDWVIGAFNANLPFDQFTVEQLAGDLLPDAAVSAKVATGFLRNEALQLEICEDQQETIKLVDRINTVATTWLGVTAGCAQCHDHKYDPLSQREYYQMLAYFNDHPRQDPLKNSDLLRNVDGRGNMKPLLKFPSPAQTSRLAECRDHLLRLDTEIQNLLQRTRIPATLLGSSHTGREVTIIAWEEIERDRITRQESGVPACIRAILQVEPGQRTEQQAADLRAFYLEQVEPRATFARLHTDKERLQKEARAAEAEISSTMVLSDPPDRADTFVLTRGDVAQKGEKVSPGVPAFLPPLPSTAKNDRLSFARWLTSPWHPLTARVTVNRVWQQHFGVGLVDTPEDFGTQGNPPTHPELLDWLAMRFIESGWDVKALHRLIVNSATYRQSSWVTPQLLQVDPQNRLYARGPRFRLPAEAIRDNALALAGLLDRRVGGTGVFPYQPVGLWEEVRHINDFTAQQYAQSHGRDLYRRGIYVYWKRTRPHPALALFDVPNRDVCTVRRQTTNTAIQALVLLNDPTIVECARSVAVRMCRETRSGSDERLAHGFRLCTARPPRPHELTVLCRVYAGELARFRAQPAEATALLGVGESRAPQDMDPPELAALTVVAHLLLNLAETLTLE
jgi:hypothetical protein